MDNNFSDVMTKRSDAELLKIVTEQRDDYQLEAVDAAEKELTKRNLSVDQIEEAKNENKIADQIKSEKANEKLGSGWKVLTFIFPGVIQLIFAGTFVGDGYDRKASELTKWTLYGYGFYFFIILIITCL